MIRAATLTLLLFAVHLGAQIGSTSLVNSIRTGRVALVVDIVRWAKEEQSTYSQEHWRTPGVLQVPKLVLPNVIDDAYSR